jgi:hypothetical protein
MPRTALEVSEGKMLNTCAAEPLREMLWHLKRSFWPFAWDSTADPIYLSGGGFRCGHSAFFLESQYTVTVLFPLLL